MPNSVSTGSGTERAQVFGFAPTNTQLFTLNVTSTVQSGNFVGIGEVAFRGVTSAIPEPEIYAMLGMGLGLLGWIGRRKRLQAA